MAVTFGDFASDLVPVSVNVKALEPMDAEHTEKQEKIKELRALVAKGKKGINECRYKAECEFARACPGTC